MTIMSITSTKRKEVGGIAIRLVGVLVTFCSVLEAHIQWSPNSLSLANVLVVRGCDATADACTTATANCNDRHCARAYTSKLMLRPHPKTKFTGKERDAETGLDYFGERYMSAAQGRFTSPDPLPGWQRDPQSWNMYSYGRNNPLKYVDPTGETYRVCDSEAKKCGDISDAEFEKFRSSSRDLSFRGGSSGEVYAGRTLSGTFAQNDVDVHPGVAMALHAAGVTADRELKNFVRGVAITAATGPLLGAAAGALTKGTANLSLLRQVSRLASNSTVKHLVNRGHIAEFQKLDPALNVDGVIKLGIEVAETGSQVSGSAFVKTMQIGGKEVTVRSVLNSNNAIRSVHILQ